MTERIRGWRNDNVIFEIEDDLVDYLNEKFEEKIDGVESDYAIYFTAEMIACEVDNEMKYWAAGPDRDIVCYVDKGFMRRVFNYSVAYEEIFEENGELTLKARLKIKRVDRASFDDEILRENY